MATPVRLMLRCAPARRNGRRHCRCGLEPTFSVCRRFKPNLREFRTRCKCGPSRRHYKTEAPRANVSARRDRAPTVRSTRAAMPPTARRGTGPLGPAPTRRPAAGIYRGPSCFGRLATAFRLRHAGRRQRGAYALREPVGRDRRNADSRPPRLGRRRVAPRSQQIAQRAFRRTWFDEALAPSRTIVSGAAAPRGNGLPIH